MPRPTSLLRTLALLVALPLASGATGAAPEVVEGELILKLRAGADEARGHALARGHGAEVIDSLSELKMHRLRLPEAARAAVQAALSRRAEVEWVEPNALLEPVAVPDDPRLGDAWHLAALGAPSAWDLSTGAGVTVAILDSGVDPAHPDLQGKLVPGYNFYEGNSDTRDVFGHGTRVAGAAAAATNNGSGVASIGWDAGLMPIRVTSSSGYASAWAIAQGLSYAVDRGARVMNLSFAGVGGSSTVANAAAHVVQNGGVVVAAAGNCGCTESTPDRAELLTVGALAQGDVLWSGSSRGDHVDFTAPGAAILTTLAGGSYGAATGTSFSAPVAAGLVALLLSLDPSLDAAEVEALLQRSAVDLGAAGWDPAYGHGGLDAATALQIASTLPPPPSDATPPSVAIMTPEPGAPVRGVVSVEVGASDEGGVAAVELYVDGSLHARDALPPFSFGWDTRGVADGMHALEAVARDTAGNAATSDPHVVQVENAVADASPPWVAIVSPTDGSAVSKTVQIQVAARDDVQVSRVEVLLDGVLLDAQSCGSASCVLSFPWNTRKAARGSHVLQARAIDASGREAPSAPVGVAVGATGTGGEKGAKGKGRFKR
jgi:subtilisin family serine protease